MAGVADTKARRATDPKSEIASSTFLFRVVWKNFDMMMFLSVDASEAG
jgi:hypothetical protein